MHGYTPATDAVLHASVIYRHAGAPDDVLGTVDSNPQPAPPGQLQVWIQGSVSAPALAASAGDGLVLHIDYPSGSASFAVIETTMTIP